jgi:FMN-dependent NADH-azoreductase
MGTVLHIQSSPRGDESTSAAVAAAFLEAYRRVHPADTAETLDLFAADLPPFEAPLARAKYAVLAGKPPVGEAERAWARVLDVVDHFTAADKYVFSVPMWNFGIPYRLKHYFDLLVQPGLTFSYSADTGYSGLVTGRPALVIYARGGAYGEGSGAEAMDFQRPYVRTLLQFIGFTDVYTIVAEPMLMGGPEVATQALDEAKRQAIALAPTF